MILRCDYFPRAGNTIAMSIHQQQYSESSTAPAGASMPRAIDMASKLMVLGAVVSVANTIIALAAPGVTHTSTTNNDHTHSAAVYGPAAVIGGLLGLAFWLLMARLVRRGRKSARIVSTILMVLGILGVSLDIAGAAPPWFKVLAVIPPLIGAVSVALLWRRDSSAFFDRTR
ncbi:hypothetical protein [Actinomadura terrae]|uniref:hypothetical protein n=1 Tax=Actinomadura terrae TaxID=604353 RepID=UPI001FA77F06|nr:hypothetical protein [Actinomadura terrae]